MLQNFVLFFIVTVQFFYCSAEDAKCPQGTILSLTDPNVCYLFSNKTMVYSDAEDYCEQAGGYLTSMHDGFEKDFFEGLASPFGVDSFWIGGSDKFNATWQWEDNSPFDFNDWAPGQPNGSAGLCLYFKTYNGYWYGDACNQLRPFLCKVKPEKPGLASCPIGWSFYSKTQNCYKAIKNIPNMSCASAFQQCTNLNATVVSIHSFRENSFVAGLSAAGNSIIGLVPLNNVWQWQDNSKMDYTNWYVPTTSDDNSCIFNYGIVGYPGPGLWEPYGFNGIYASQVVCKLGGYENSLIRESDTACPNGTFANSNDPNICYKIYSDPLNWYAAEQSCTKGNGHLVSVHNSDENAFFLSAIYFHVPNAVDFWTGGFVNNKTWKWSDGSAFDFSIWYPGNPQFDSGLCTSVKISNQLWYSTKCDDMKPFICTVPPETLSRPSCPPNFSYFDITKKCYQVVQLNESKPNCEFAKNVCFNLTSKMTSIHSDEENYFIAGLAMDPYVSWTAFGLFGNADSWQWLDGTPVDYTKWYQSPPKPSVNNCGLMLTDSGNSDISKWQPFFDIGHISQVACEVNAF